MSASVCCQIYDKNKVSDTLVGQCTVELRKLLLGVPIQKWYNLEPPDGEEADEILGEVGALRMLCTGPRRLAHQGDEWARSHTAAC